MIKSILILLLFPILLFSAQQIILVVADDFNTSKASLEFFEDTNILFKTDVNIGKNGIGWGIGEYKFLHKKGEPLKYEGDKKAPAGIFKLTNIFGYSSTSNYKLPYLYTSEKLICVDDSNSPFYNQIIEATGHELSFEHMKRQDNQYKYGIMVEHNKNAIAKRGSCIFIHIQKKAFAPTVGCTSMQEQDLTKIIQLLDKNKNPLLIQIPKSAASQVLKLYPYLHLSKLLQE